MLMRDPLWALWVMNPYMDSLLKPQGVTHTHWVNLCVTPLHGPCWGALQSMTNHHAFIHRVRNGEVKQSQRTRYIGDPGAYPRVIG